MEEARYIVLTYKVSEVIARPIIGGNQDYLEWLEQSIA